MKEQVIIPEEAVEADKAVLEVPEHLRGEDNATTVRAMLTRLERQIK